MFNFATVATEEWSCKLFSDPVMRSLHQNLTSICAKVMGMDKSRIKIHSLIWGMCIKKNPPLIWLTINPADMQDPIAQVLCRQDINLDKLNTAEHHLSDIAIAANPYASASFFHLIVNTVLKCLLGIKGLKSCQHITQGMGILGTVKGYVGMVEAQGRGTLHLHMLLWLRGTPSSDKMKECLQNNAFSSRIQHFMSANIHADIDGLPGPALLAIPWKPRVTFS